VKLISDSLKCDDQPIDAPTMMGESRFLTSWVDPSNLEIQETYKQLTEGITDQRERIVAVWEFVKDIPYTPYVSALVKVGRMTFAQKDVWLSAGQTLQVNKLNCMNKSVLLTSLLRQELPAESVWICLNNVQINSHSDGHAVGYIRLEDDYIFETTNPSIRSPFMRASDADIYEAAIFVNDKATSYIPGVSLEVPFRACCIRWLGDYVNDHLCDSYI